MKSGIYTITNIINNKIYIGKASYLDARGEQHFRTLSNGTHHCIHLQRAFDIYGEINFKYELLIECPKELLDSEEHYWATLLNVHNNEYGYNIRPTSPLGKGGVSEETKEKISKAFKKPIILLDKQGLYIDRYDSITEMCKDRNIPQDKVSGVLAKKHKYYKKFTFILEKDYNKNENYSIKPCIKEGKRILMYNKEGELEKEFVSLTEAAKFVNSKPDQLWKVINRERKNRYKHKGYIWNYKLNY